MARTTKKEVMPREMTLESLQQSQLWLETLDARTLPRDPFIRHLYKEVVNSMGTLVEAQKEMIERQNQV